MRLKKRWLIILSLLMINSSISVMAQSNLGAMVTSNGQATNKETISDDLPASTIIAKVNDEVITVGEIEKQVNDEIEVVKARYQLTDNDLKSNEMKKNIKELKAEIIKNMIMKKVGLIKGKEMKLEPAKAEVEAAFNKTKSNFKSEKDFLAALQSAQLTVESYKAQIKDEITIEKVVNDMTKGITITDQEVKNEYDANRKMYTKGPGANMYHILVATVEEANAIKAACDKGVSFAELAKQYGTDGTRDRGGELGYIEYASKAYDQDFLNGAKELKEGEVSQPVKTQFGYHIIKVTGVQSSGYTIPLNEVKEEIKKSLFIAKKSAHIDEQIEKWQQEMKIVWYEENINKYLA